MGDDTGGCFGHVRRSTRSVGGLVAVADRAASTSSAGEGAVAGSRWRGEHEDRRGGRGEAGDNSGVGTRFAEEGLAKLGKVRAGRGRKSTIPQEKIDEIVYLTRYSTPEGQTHWSCRTMAAQAGVSTATVQRGAARGLKPHLVETFKLSNDPKFEEKLIDVVGLYLNPPQQAIVLCMDEKSSVQALDRTQPSLPMKPGRAQTMTHDYKGNGTATLFAALDVLTGKVIGQCLPRHRHIEFVKFLRTIDREVPEELAVHLICDDCHPQAPERAGLARQTSPIPPALHPDLLVVAQPGRTLVSGTNRQGAAPRRVSLRTRPRRQDRGLSRRAQ